MPDTRPNLLLIMTDQQRGDCLGCAGHPVLETPYLDQLASEGTRFACAYSAVPSCLPARASLLTGMDQWHTGILGMGKGQGTIPSNFAHTLPGELARAGYHTQAIGKNHFHPQRALNGYHNCILDESGRTDSPGFVSDYRRWFEEHKDGPYGYRDHAIDWNSWMGRPSHLPEHLHPTHWTAQQAIDWLDRRDPEKPFFLKVSFARPHSPYDPPRWYFDQYANRRMPDPFMGDWMESATGGAASPAATGGASVNAWRSRRSDAEVQRARAAYYGSITFIDHQIGRLLNEMRRQHGAALANTLIIFLSDHGDMLGDHHLWRKTYAYEGSARVPLIVRPPAGWSDAPRGQVHRQVVELRDVMPTFLEAAGVQAPQTLDGCSLLPLTRGQKVDDWRPWLHGEHVACYSHEQAMHYLTDGVSKYIWFPYLGRQQLFDLTDDPGETRDLAASPGAGAGASPAHADRLALWRQHLIDTLAQRGSGDLLDHGQLRRLDPHELWTSPHYRQPPRTTS
ncbi:MAG: arylsulfatase [Phycisphaeraceae bacterium]